MACIAVVGSLARDEVVRLPEPVCWGRHLQGSLPAPRLGGGGANVAIPLVHAGHRVSLVAPVGADPVGRELSRELAQEGVDPRLLLTVPGPSTRSLVLLDPSGERTVVNLHRCQEPAPPTRLLDLQADAIYVRSRDLTLAPLLEETTPGLVVAHMPPCEPGSRPASILIASADDVAPELLDDPVSLGRSVAGPRFQWIIVTRGAQGAEAFSATERISVAPPPTTVLDTTGAGDAFAAGLVHALVEGASMAVALATAVAWGAAAVAWDGSFLPRDVVDRLLA